MPRCDFDVAKTSADFFSLTVNAVQTEFLAFRTHAGSSSAPQLVTSMQHSSSVDERRVFGVDRSAGRHAEEKVTWHVRRLASGGELADRKQFVGSGGGSRPRRVASGCVEGAAVGGRARTSDGER